MLPKLLLLSGCIFLFASCNDISKKPAPATLAAQTTDSKTTTEATCTGDKSCNACKNCKYCKHCAKEGASCGVCK